jgi:quercetin dioxygenase-like cupin family protein
MYLASKESSTAPMNAAEVAGSGNVDARWLINRECGGSDCGRIAAIDVGASGAVTLKPGKDNEETVFVLAGHGAARAEGIAADVRAETVLFVPGGGALELRAHGDGLRLLLIQSDSDDLREDGASGSHHAGRGAAAAAQIVQLDQIENVAFHRPELGFLHVAARWLVGGNGAKSRSVVVGQSTFVPGAAHLLHRHDHGDEFFYVFDGLGDHLTEHGEVPMQPGNVVFAPRREWHGFRNTGDRPVRAIFGYFRVNSLEDAGYEVHESGIRSTDG